MVVLFYFSTHNRLSLNFPVGDDFLSFRRSFTIMPGESELQIPITLIDDVFPEKLEKIEVLLHNSAGVFIDTPSKAVVSILNDDPDILGR